MNRVTRLLHISDLHAGPHFLPEVADALVAAANQLKLQAVIVSGDLTQRAKREQFSQVGALLRRFPALPMAVVPGNHDIPLYRVWERVMSPLGEYERMRQSLSAVGGAGCYPVCTDVGNVRLLALNSTSALRAIKGGRVSDAQMDRAEALLNAPGDIRWRVLVMHHNLLNPPGLKHHAPVPRAQRLLARLERMGVDIVLCGHLHQAFVSQTLDVHPGENRARGMVVCNCGTSTSRRGRGAEREKNSFNVVVLNEQGVLTIEHWIYFDHAAGFRQVSTHEFSFAPGRHDSGA